ncbi:TetR/AcrR family transcriptional regulator [Ralstonia syzygii]|uniref:TetR/AcrR family transcriptional regulator n=1 Tax=Ralstonia syzygii TaxID=28097 RepID=UPI0018D1E17E|nr:TetR/AcrR family transcriptional regulator [Ralstonia syzygii]
MHADDIVRNGIEADRTTPMRETMLQSGKGQEETTVGEKPIRRRKPRLSVDRDDWLEAAKSILIESGIDNVKVEPLAARLQIARSSFYWNFENRKALLDALLEYWIEENNRSLRELAIAAQKSDPSGDPDATKKATLKALIPLFVDERQFSPKFDLAVRDWARKDPVAALAVQKIDQERIKLLSKIFLALGHDKLESTVRAKILYYHQLGYYLVGVEESSATRMRAAPLYLEIISGLQLD